MSSLFTPEYRYTIQTTLNPIKKELKKVTTEETKA